MAHRSSMPLATCPRRRPLGVLQNKEEFSVAKLKELTDAQGGLDEIAASKIAKVLLAKASASLPAKKFVNDWHAHVLRLSNNTKLHSSKSTMSAREGPSHLSTPHHKMLTWSHRARKGRQHSRQQDWEKPDSSRQGLIEDNMPLPMLAPSRSLQLR